MNEEPDFVLRMILEKLDSIDKKIDGPHGLISHEVRLSAVERRLESTWKTRAALGVALFGAAVGPVLAIVIK